MSPKPLIKQLMENIKETKKLDTLEMKDDYNFIFKITESDMLGNKKYNITFANYQELCGYYNFLLMHSYLIGKDNVLKLKGIFKSYNFIIKIKRVIPNFNEKLYKYGPSHICILYINTLKRQEQLKKAENFEF